MTLIEFFITEGPEGVTLRVREPGFENLDAGGMAQRGPGARPGQSRLGADCWPVHRCGGRGAMSRLGTDETVQVLRASGGENTSWELILRLGQAPASASGLQHELSISRRAS